jgi:LysR family transcriptional regulator, transcriptional activator for bauABCD operon
MRLSNIDIRHIRVFMAVVKCGGFTAAELVLGISQSTISAHIAELERRLAFRICERGRSGFALTSRGEEFYAAAIQLVDAFAEFEDRARALKGVLAGRLRLGLIDNLISDPNCPIVRALATHNMLERGPRISIEMLPPADIEYGIAAGRIDVGISIAEKRLPALRYTPLYVEQDILLCGKSNRLFACVDNERLRREIRTAPKVIRSFLNHHDFFLLSDREDSIGATVTNIEAAAFLILAGTHIGFLPQHYAAQWIQSGEMRALLPYELSRTSEIMLIEPAQGAKPSRAVQQFAEAVSHYCRPEASVISIQELKQAAVSGAPGGRSSSH